MTDTHITLFVEDFRSLVNATGQAQRLPALERLMSKGRPRRIESPAADHLRFALFGMGLAEALPGHPEVLFWRRRTPLVSMQPVSSSK